MKKCFEIKEHKFSDLSLYYKMDLIITRLLEDKLNA